MNSRTRGVGAALVVLAVILGIGSNLAIAWVLPETPWFGRQGSHNCAFQPPYDFEADRDAVCERWQVLMMDHRRRDPTGARLMERLPHEAWRRMARPWHLNTEYANVVFQANGWPMRCLAAGTCATGRDVPKQRVGWLHPLPGWLVPGIVLWPGMLFNSALFAGLWLGGLLVLRARARRRARSDESPEAIGARELRAAA